MKKILLLVCLVLSFVVYGQQNHVPNCSFEQFTNCSAIPVGWRSYISTPDYFNVCGGTVPTSSRGYQHAAHGNAYMGILDFASAINYGYRESLTSRITPLVIGETYEVSLSVSVADKSYRFTNSLCVHFFDTGATTLPSFTATVPFTPSISFSNYGMITDTQNWVRLSARFYADSAYDNIVIGGFLNASNVTSSLTGFASPIAGYNYIFFDSVVVKLYDSLFIDVTNASYCVGDTINMPFYSTKKKHSNNVFTIQLSNSTGSFVTPVNIGSLIEDTSGTIKCIIPANTTPGTGYRMRIVSSNYPDTTDHYNTVIIKPKPNNFNAVYNAPVCSGNPVNFNASSTSTGVTYTWTGPNSFVYNGPAPSIGSAGSVHNGNYIATATLNGCSLKDTIALNVKPMPATPTATNNGPLCEGESLNLTGATTTTGVTYDWTGPNSYTSGSQNPTITNTTTAMSGNYIVTATLDGCSSSATTTVLVNPMPAAVTVSSNSPVCEGGTLQLLSTASSTGVIYNWTGPNSFTGNTQNSSVSNSTTAATGWYKMNVDLNGCIYKDSVHAIVNVIPTTPVITYNSPLCAGETLTLNGGNISGASYSWTGTNNYTSTQSIATRSNMQTADAGIYKANVTVNGCTSPEGTVTVSLNPAPFVVIFSNPMDSICQGDPAMFTAIPNNHGGTPAYQWMVNNQPVATGITYTTTTLNDQDVIRCDMIENTKCSVPYKDASNDITMTVLPWLAPTVSITANPTTPLKENQYVTFTAAPVNAGVFPTYQWKRNGQNIVGATGNTWSANTLSDNDNVTVVLTSSYKCPQPFTASSNSITVRVLTGVNDIDGITGLTLYPNPNKGSFIIKGIATLALKEEISIEVINSVGQVIHHDVIKPQEQNWQQEITLDAPAGVYLLRLQTANGTQNIMFNIEH